MSLARVSQPQHNADYTTQSGIGEGLFNADGTAQSTKVSELTRTYAEATAGTPLAMAFDNGSGSGSGGKARFTFSFALNASCAAPTLIYMNRGDHYANGYAVDVQPPGAVDPAELPDNRCVRATLFASSTLVCTRIKKMSIYV